MIKFKQYYNILLEGGNVFKAFPTQRIYREDVPPTVGFLSRIIGIDLMKNLAGSTGKSESSGDLDILLPEGRFTKEKVYNILSKWCEERNLNPKDYIARTGISVHFRTPIYGKDNEYVQSDLMIVPDVKFAKFALCNNEELPLKGKHWQILMSNIAKNINMRWGNVKGLTDRVSGVVVEDRDPNRVARILFGDQKATARNLFNIESILKTLLKKYKDVNVVLGLIDEARQTILKDNIDIANLLSVKESKITSGITAEGKRVGIQHLYSQYKPEEYSMSLDNFISLVYALEDSNGIINPGNSSISEKADGLGVRFGITHEDKFFLQGSYTKPVVDGNFEGQIKHEPTKIAFEQSFNKVKSLLYKTLLRYKKDFKLDCLRVQAEWLYSPFALKREDRDDVVYFVATNYERDKLGIWSTFPIINITDCDGNELLDNEQFDIMKSLVDLSTKDIKFLPLNIDVFEPIDLYNETQTARQLINTFLTQHPDYESVLYNKSQKKPDRDAKKEMKSNIISTFLPIQKRMHEKILDKIHRLAGKLGEYEGLVIKLKNQDGSNFLFKIISPTFHKNKGRDI